MNDIRAYIDILIRRWMFVLAMPLLAIAAAFVVTMFTKPTYEATALIALSPATVAVPITGQVPPYYLTVDSPRRLPASFTPTYYIALLKSDSVASQVAIDMSVAITSNASDKSLIEISVRGNDAARATSTANQYAQVGVQRIQKILTPSGDDVTAAQKELDAAERAIVKFAQDNGLEYDLARLRGSTSLVTEKKIELTRLVRDRDVAEQVYINLARDFEQSKILAASSYAPTSLAASVPAVPVSPKLSQNVLMAAVLGLAMGVLGAFALEFVTRR